MKSVRKLRWRHIRSREGKWQSAVIQLSTTGGSYPTCISNWQSNNKKNISGSTPRFCTFLRLFYGRNRFDLLTASTLGSSINFVTRFWRKTDPHPSPVTFRYDSLTPFRNYVTKLGHKITTSRPKPQGNIQSIESSCHCLQPKHLPVRTILLMWTGQLSQYSD